MTAPTNRTGKPWTEAEDRVLAIHYPSRGPHRMREFLPHRADHSIAARASKLGVRCRVRIMPNSFTPEEVAILREWFPKGGTPACAERLPHRTPGTIKTKAVKLGLRRYGYKRSKANPVIQLPPPRPLTFEEKLARVASGELRTRPAQHFPYRAGGDHRSLTGGSLA